MSQGTQIPTITWPAIGLQLSRLAFGCAPIMGRVGKRAALNAMAMAFEGGITHFDVARSYGFGEAENIVGAFLRTRQSRTTLTTKFGILPQPLSAARRLLVPALRAARRLAPSVGRALRRQSSAALQAGHYKLADAKRSLDTSLRALGRDSVDLLLIHDCSIEAPVDDDVIDFLIRLKENGTIRAWGFATSGRHSGHYRERYSQLLPVIQTEFSNYAPAANLLPSIVHSLYSNLGHFLEADSGAPHSLLVQWAKKHGLDDAELPDLLPRLLMESAVQCLPSSVVLCSMFDRQHIETNISCVTNPRFTARMIEEFHDVVGRINSVQGRNGGKPE